MGLSDTKHHMDRPRTTLTLDDNNRLSLPAELLDRLGLKPGCRLSVEPDESKE
jgi:bifunctional DNA-binding transcriptional regulator/antitoxin component of YhaV-PrlF toxin-antitoxin module